MRSGKSDYKIIRVTPTLSTDAYAQGDVLFVATEIPDAVIGLGGCSKLVGGYVFDKSDGSDDITFVFTQGQFSQKMESMESKSLESSVRVMSNTNKIQSLEISVAKIDTKLDERFNRIEELLMDLD